MSEISVGDKFGNWTVIQDLPKEGKNKYFLIECCCEHKTQRKMEGCALKKWEKDFCNKCRPRESKILIGEIYGKWKVISEVTKENRKSKEKEWLCECQCEFKTQQQLKTSQLTAKNSNQCMKCYHFSKRSDINIGDKFGQWTVLKESEERNGHCVCYLCECNCDDKTQQIVRSTSLIQEISTRCLKCSQKNKNYPKTITLHKKRFVGGYKFLSNEYFNSCIANAKARNLPFEVTIEYVYNLYEQQHGYCALTGQYLTFNRSDLSRPQDASLDRKDNDKGYLEGNLRWVHKDANLVRGELTDNELFFWCFRVVKTIFTKYPPLEYKIPEHHYKWKGYGDLWQTTWYDIQKRSELFNRELELTIKDGWELAEKQGFRCALTGVALKFGYKSDCNASLDRRDSAKGYTKENCQWIHKTLQPMKWHLDENYFKHVCRNVYENEQLAGNIFSFI